MTFIWHMLNDDETLFCDVLERIVADKIAPLATQTDETSNFVHAQLKVLAEAGMMGANLPEAFGGSNISAPALLRAVEIVAGGCGSTASALTAHFLASDSILIGATEAQKAHWLPRMATGEALGAFALTEPSAGSDPADMKTRATREGDGWHLTGSKCFISNGGVADVLIVFAVTDPTARHRGISAFILPKHTPGFTAGPAEKTMGLKGGHVFSLALDCHLPAEALLGEEGSGFRTAMKVLDNGRVEVAAQCIGMAQAALDAAKAYASDRVIGGEALSAKQGIRWMLADMALDLYGARLMALEAARQRDTGARFSEAAAMAKLKASEAADRVADAALQIHGGYGYTRDFPIERLTRDLRIMRIYEGSSEIQRNIIAGHLLAH
ncbi:acyl-CoA dehydrogenase [Roseobacter denitrificans]|uniref:3-sulfinopropanoyl-CoA desulfinase n=1 Tax=Roseobacter denitrificans (strain ATCC 33942 / OCh 114) TaxID=375451 RepID=Q162D9_ROSDO|nr:acyl-CoA dehydrogenase family protein [Roseobacter denitrificans]ABG33154.1 acyl-CoA dehydrogenase [Roseobacter denitrificans OCh 114]AVL52516.1 acyl-CoA dehydrogenase [Roseobacter denitrificans]SFG29100.1 butyryl-CoA dehydrogenase [Roseobacter denitrificans OCh 114]